MDATDQLAQVRASLERSHLSQVHGDVESSFRASTDTGSNRGSNHGKDAVEKRLSWLEEDFAVLQRRLRDDRSEGIAATGHPSLGALVARLDGELLAERRSREAMEMRIIALEDDIRHERSQREAQLRSFSNELDTTMRALIDKMDEGLSAGAAMRERADVSEDRLKFLIQRVDQGLSAGAAALQDSLTSTGALSDTAQRSPQDLSGRKAPVRLESAIVSGSGDTGSSLRHTSPLGRAAPLECTLEPRQLNAPWGRDQQRYLEPRQLNALWTNGLQSAQVAGLNMSRSSDQLLPSHHPAGYQVGPQQPQQQFLQSGQTPRQIGRYL